ncbi:MAG: hypothetical protein RR988_05245 [Clostridia bacterium]
MCRFFESTEVKALKAELLNKLMHITEQQNQISKEQLISSIKKINVKYGVDVEFVQSIDLVKTLLVENTYVKEIPYDTYVSAYQSVYYGMANCRLNGCPIYSAAIINPFEVITEKVVIMYGKNVKIGEGRETEDGTLEIVVAPKFDETKPLIFAKYITDTFVAYSSKKSNQKIYVYIPK